MKSENPWLDGIKDYNSMWESRIWIGLSWRQLFAQTHSFVYSYKTAKVEKLSHLYDRIAYLGDFQLNEPVQGSLQRHSRP